MKISNETKVGALTAIGITILILGYNYLKGKNLTERSDELYAVFPDVKGMVVSNAVFINGLQVGKVSEMKEKDKNMSGIVVAITINKDINIPENSTATINSELLGSTSLEIILGDSKTYAEHGDTLIASVKLGAMAEITKSVNPAIDNLNKTLTSLDILIQKISTVFDPNTQNNLQSMVASLTITTRSLQRLLDVQTGVVSKSAANMETITANLARNNDKISNTIANLEKTSSNLAKVNLEEAVQSMKSSMAKLDNAVSKVNSKDGSIGLLLNDRQLYDDLLQTNRSLTTLLDDVRMNPRRYVNISVISLGGGGKKKKGPLMAPIHDTTGRQTKL